jgi:hypothetical protein
MVRFFLHVQPVFDELACTYHHTLDEALHELCLVLWWDVLVAIPCARYRSASWTRAGSRFCSCLLGKGPELFCRRTGQVFSKGLHAEQRDG